MSCREWGTVDICSHWTVDIGHQQSLDSGHLHVFRLDTCRGNGMIINTIILDRWSMADRRRLVGPALIC